MVEARGNGAACSCDVAFNAATPQNNMNTSLLMLMALLFAAATTQPNVRAAGAEKPAAASTTTKEAGARKFNRTVPFRGKVAALDAQKKTFTLSGPKQRVFQLSADTQIEKGGQPAAIEDIATGDEARGLCQIDEDGQRVVIKASFGPKVAKADPGKSKADPTEVAAGN
jgi:hypothetical protein